MPKNPSIILGLSFGHGDSSAAIVVDGCLLAAAEEERFNRKKHYGLFPMHAVQYCLAHAKISPDDVQVVAVARKPYHALSKKISLAIQYPTIVTQRHRATIKDDALSSLKKNLKTLGIKRAKHFRVEHHYAHMMSSRFLSTADDVAFLSFDGLGDFVSAAIGRSKGPQIEILDRVYFPHSLGFFYTAMTQYLGFPRFGEEFKVMGLSAYGKPKYLPSLRELVRESDHFGFQLNLEAFPILIHPIKFSLENGQPACKPFFNTSFLTQVIGLPPRKITEPIGEAHWDLAKSVQMRFEEIANHMLGQLYDRVGCETLALSGGCAHNSVWVGKIPQVSHFKHVLVAPASSDAGIAVGAALAAANEPAKVQGGHWALIGPEAHEIKTIDSNEENNPQILSRTFANDDQLVEWLSGELANQKIVGLVHGRMEFGPRALGARSILADPRQLEMRDRLNARVKHRELFRPFAASVLREHQDKWFTRSFYSPTMEAVFEVKESARGRIPAVVHVDNSCRIQSVERINQPFYYDLIEAFRKKTGIPMLINTSFNDSEPIVCSEADALRCFKSTELDHLVIGNRVYSKAESLALTA